MAKARPRMMKVRDDEFKKIREFKEKNDLSSMGEALNKMIKIIDGVKMNGKRRARIIEDIEF